MDKWYADYINLEPEVLADLIEASFYLEIKPLSTLSCAKVASLIKKKSPEEIR